ncbi:hypothetical protein FB004_11942 [Sinorhizobium medicae]|nr:hypothetical protein FB004_11942 [Sinorhizobium medicae]
MGCIIQLLLIDALSPRRLSTPRLFSNENKGLKTRRALPYIFDIKGPLCGGPSFEDKAKAFPGGAS